MKITPSLLSIPPYISTAWDNIASLQAVEEGPAFRLTITLKNKTKVEVPHLDKITINKIFEFHAQYSLHETTPASPSNPLSSPFSFSLPLGGGPDSAVVESLSASMQHNESQANLPPIAPDVLKKVVLIARVFGLEDPSVFPPPKPDCRCLYCQFIGAMMQEAKPLEPEDEAISTDDLKFRNWKIEQTADRLYLVTNVLDETEHYSVYLGEPLGCTCGKKNCEHIREVLST